MISKVSVKAPEACFICGVTRANWSAWHRSRGCWVYLCHTCRWHGKPADGAPAGVYEAAGACRQAHTAATGNIVRYPWESYSQEIGKKRGRLAA